VVPDEDIDLRSGMGIRLDHPVPAGANIRQRGKDVGEGDILLRSGTSIDARQMAVLAATGVGMVGVWRRPRVALLSIGNELVPPGGSPAQGQIIDVNKVLLRGLVEANGGEVVDVGIAGDTVDAIAKVLSSLPEADVLLTTSGVAGSECDVTLAGVRAAGGESSRLELALKPGRLVAFGRLEELRSLHLPGNPIAALVTAQLFLIPLLRTLSGCRVAIRTIVVDAGEPLFHRRGRTEFVLVKIVGQAQDGRPIVVRSGKGGSGALKPLVEADGFAEIGAEEGDVSTGCELRFHPFGAVFG
jgi:molybdopterin molybdotransferase